MSRERAVARAPRANASAAEGLRGHLVQLDFWADPRAGHFAEGCNFFARGATLVPIRKYKIMRD